MNLNSVRSINPNKNSNFYYEQDLLNNKLTWRLYTDSGTLILRGFYQMSGAFGISHEYSKGEMGDTLETMIRSRLRDTVRSLSRINRNLYNRKEDINNLKNRLFNSKAVDWIGNASGDVAGFFTNSDEVNQRVTDNFDRVRDEIVNFDIAENWDKIINTSKVVTQGSKSILYESTDVSIPDISNLETIIWTESSDKNCKDIIESIYESYFIGNFEEIEGMGGGYWTAPRDINLAKDNPISTDKIPGSFTLHIGNYSFENLILKSFKWQFSREMARVGNGNGVTTLPYPAYAKVSVDLDIAKYLTKSHLKNTYVPNLDEN